MLQKSRILRITYHDQNWPYSEKKSHKSHLHWRCNKELCINIKECLKHTELSHENSISSIAQLLQEKLQECLFCTSGIELKYLLAINSALPMHLKTQQLVCSNFYSLPYCCIGWTHRNRRKMLELNLMMFCITGASHREELDLFLYIFQQLENTSDFFPPPPLFCILSNL